MDGAQLINFLFIYLYPALLTPHPITPFTTEEITGCINETAKVLTKQKKSVVLFFFKFHVVLFQ